MTTPRGCPSSEICRRLRRGRQNLHRAGVFGALRVVATPFGKNAPLYDEADVARWEKALRRRDGLVALGRLVSTSSLSDSLTLGKKYDIRCPRCKGIAVHDPSEPGRIWCPVCGEVKR